MTPEEKVHLQRLRLFRRAEELGNVSKACREAGVARSLYYQIRDRYRKYGADGLHPKHRRGRPGRPPALDVQIERAGPSSESSRMEGVSSRVSSRRPAKTSAFGRPRRSLAIRSRMASSNAFKGRC